MDNMTIIKALRYCAAHKEEPEMCKFCPASQEGETAGCPGLIMNLAANAMEGMEELCENYVRQWNERVEAVEKPRGPQ